MQGLASQGVQSADCRTTLLYLFFLIFIVVGGIASAEATKGLCGRPLETFALHSHVSWFLSLQGEIASAEATKGLCGRPLETFALHSHVSWFLSLQGEIASAEATRGLSDRPLDPFGSPLPELTFSAAGGIAPVGAIEGCTHRFGSSVRISLIDMQYGSASWLRPCSSITCAVFCIAGKALRIR